MKKIIETIFWGLALAVIISFICQNRILSSQLHDQREQSSSLTDEIGAEYEGKICGTEEFAVGKRGKFSIDTEDNIADIRINADYNGLNLISDIPVCVCLGSPENLIPDATEINYVWRKRTAQVKYNNTSEWTEIKLQSVFGITTLGEGEFLYGGIPIFW